MPELYIDLRNNAARVILEEKGTVMYGRTFDQKVNDEEALQQLLTVVRSDSGTGFRRAHLLVPSEDVVVSRHRTQAQALDDVRMIVGRALAQESGESDPLFVLTRMAAEHSQQVYQAEYLSRQVIDRYLKMFRSVGLRLVTVSTAFQAQQAFLSEVSGEIHQVQGLLDIGGDGVIEAVFFSNTEIIQHEVLAIGGGDGERAPEEPEQADAERSERRKLYETMNNLHIVYSRFMNQNPQAVLGKLWLAGNGSGVAGLPGVLAEAMGTETGLLLPEEVKNLSEGQGYATLIGFARQLQLGRPMNFLPPEMGRRFQVNQRLVILLVGSLYTLALAAAVGQIELHYASLQNQLVEENSSLQMLKSGRSSNRDQLRDLRMIARVEEEYPPIFEIFRELTVLLPKGVFLEGVEYEMPQRQSGGKVKVSTVMVYDTEFGSRRLLSKYVSALDSSTILSRHDEPVISYRTIGDQKIMTVAISCTVPKRKRGD